MGEMGGRDKEEVLSKCWAHTIHAHVIYITTED